MDDRTNFGNRDRGRIVAGLILVAVGAALLMRNMGYDLPYWLFTWPVILVLVGIYSGIKHNFRNNTWFIFILVGFFFLLDDIMPGLKLEPSFWPVAIIILGILFIIRPRKNRWINNSNEAQNKLSGMTADAPSNQSEDSSYYSADYLRVDSVFSGVNRIVLSKNFQGGNISCVFGGAEIDLSQADMQGTVVLKIDLVFGGVKLVVPPHWTIQNQVGGVFHGVEDKRKYNTVVGADPNKMLILKGSAVFAGVDIRSY